jgi:hypothetical protein
VSRNGEWYVGLGLARQIWKTAYGSQTEWFRKWGDSWTKFPIRESTPRIRHVKKRIYHLSRITPSIFLLFLSYERVWIYHMNPSSFHFSMRQFCGTSWRPEWEHSATGSVRDRPIRQSAAVWEATRDSGGYVNGRHRKSAGACVKTKGLSLQDCLHSDLSALDCSPSFKKSKPRHVGINKVWPWYRKAARWRTGSIEKAVTSGMKAKFPPESDSKMKMNRNMKRKWKWTWKTQGKGRKNKKSKEKEKRRFNQGIELRAPNLIAVDPQCWAMLISWNWLRNRSWHGKTRRNERRERKKKMIQSGNRTRF